MIGEHEIVIEENNKQQQEMAAPMRQPSGPLSQGDLGSSPHLGRNIPGLNGSLVNGNGSVRNGEVHMLRSESNVDGSSNQFVEKQDDAHFLANLLAEERQRCNQHKDNYNTLKQEHRKYVCICTTALVRGGVVGSPLLSMSTLY